MLVQMCLENVLARVFARPTKSSTQEGRVEDGPVVQEEEKDERKGQDFELIEVDPELETIPSTPKSKSGSQGSLSGRSSSINEKKDVFIHFEILKASQHKVRVKER